MKQRRFMRKIGLVVALGCEAGSMEATLGEKVSEEQIGNMRITEYMSNGAQLYIIETGIGEISAAVATSALIYLKGVSAIINFGLAGSLKSNYKAKDIVSIRELVHYDFTLDSSDPDKTGKYLFNEDNFVNVVSYGIFADAVKSLGISEVRVASGDKFINSGALKEHLVNKFDCDIADMESMGIYLACKQNNIPCVMIKAISDNADESASEDFVSLISNAVDYYVEAVHRLIKDIL